MTYFVGQVSPRPATNRQESGTPALQFVISQLENDITCRITCLFCGGVIFRSPRVTMAFPSGLKTRRAQDYVNISLGHNTRRLLKNSECNMQWHLCFTQRHSRESGNPGVSSGYWMPVFTGMTNPTHFECDERLFQHPARSA